MKDLLLVMSFLACFMVGCKKEEIKYVSEMEAGGKVQRIIVSPSSKQLFVDSDLPKLSFFCVPSNAADTTVTWESSRPEILKVNKETGELSWGVIQNSEVLITATSNDGSMQKGSCVFIVKNVFGVYKHIDVTKELGIWILDKNVGATREGEEGVFSNKIPGNYYHYRCNTIVANREFGGPDGPGTIHYYKEKGNRSWSILGGYPEFNTKWEGADLNSLKAVEWTVAENTPCPKGWRLPTKAELENMAYKTNPLNYKTAREQGAAILLRNKLLLAFSGYMELPGDTFDAVDSYWWSSDWKPDKKEAYCLRVPEAASTKREPLQVVLKNIKGIAIPVRCVRSK